MKKITFFILFAVLISILFGCNKDKSPANNNDQSNRVSTGVSLIMYFADETEDINARMLSIDLSDATMILSQDELFEVSGSTGWLDWIYPISLSDNLLVLAEAPIGEPAIKYAVAAPDELYCGDYVLTFNNEKYCADITRNDALIASIELSFEGTFLIPQAFFIDSRENIVIFGNTAGKTFDKINPVSLIYANEHDDVFVLELAHDFSSMYNDERELSKINMPYNTPFYMNIYGNPQSETFLWNEGANIVEINPYDGIAKVILSVSEVEADMPHLDTYRDYYGFFTGLGYQNGIYIAQFPNYNNPVGSIAVFYSNTGEFLGSVLGTEYYISYLNKDNAEIDRIDNEELNAYMFIPQGKQYP